MDAEYVQEEPRKLVKSKRFANVAIGNSCTFAATHNGDLLGWGKGLVDFKAGKAQLNEPVPLIVDGSIKSMSAGPDHAAVVNSQGEVFTWGKNGGWFRGGGQLGHGDRTNLTSPKKVDFLVEYGAKIISVGCGQRHTVFLTNDGEVLSCGDGEYGRIGTGNTSDAVVPEPLDSLSSEDIVQIAVGYDHNLALTAKGTVYSWGRNHQGQLGHADSYVDIYSMEEFPRRIENEGLHGDDGISTKTGKDFDENVLFSQIAAGNGRSAAVTKDGHLFIWGARISHRPKLIERNQLGGLSVKKVVIGGDSSRSVVAIITEDDGLWTLGDASSKMLGRPDLKGKHVIPERVPLFKGKRVADVYAGFGSHIFAKVIVDGNDA